MNVATECDTVPSQSQQYDGGKVKGLSGNNSGKPEEE